MSSLFSDFGQKIDLTVRIKEILAVYPDGSIFKELIQNADDATASIIKFVYDKREHQTFSLIDEKMKNFQGPSLLVYNDSVFTDSDFESISNIGNSTKRGLITKTGRFGIGFNSTYHLTDMPSFISNKYIVYFDPHALYLPNVNINNPGKRIEIENTDLSMFKDQFEPFNMFDFNINDKKPYNGTLFRLPLRNHELAKISKISNNVPNMNELIPNFVNEISSTLLFLKHIRTIEWYIWEENDDHMNLIHSVDISSLDNSIMNKKELKDWGGIINISINSKPFINNSFSFSSDFISSVEYWMIYSRLNYKDADKLIAKMSSPNNPVALLPWGGVASRLDDSIVEGRAYCFLPLPVKTGLPIHLNGYFELSSNRRDIWWGRELHDELKTIWNKTILENSVSDSYLSFLMDLQKFVDVSQNDKFVIKNNKITISLAHYYSYFPKLTKSEAWDIVKNLVINKLETISCLWSEVNNGIWIKPCDSVVVLNENLYLNDPLYKILLSCHLPILSMSIDIQFSSWQIFSADFIRRCISIGNFSKLNYESMLIISDYVIRDINQYNKDKLFGLSIIPLSNSTFGIIFESSSNINLFLPNKEQFELIQPHESVVNINNLPSNFKNWINLSETSLSFNIKKLDHYNFCLILSKHFPESFLNLNIVPFDLQYEEFIKRLLFYFSSYNVELPNFCLLPVILNSNKYLVKPRSQSIFKIILNFELKSILQLLNIYIADENFPVFNLYLEFNLINFLNFIDVEKPNLNLYFKLLNNSQIDYLVNHLFVDSSVKLSEIQLKIIADLPIFATYKLDVYSSLSEKLMVPIVNWKWPPQFLGSDFIIIDKLPFYFSSLLKKISILELFKVYIEPNLSNFSTTVDRNKFILALIQNIHLVQDIGWKDYILSLSIIPNRNDVLVCPYYLYSPQFIKTNLLDASVFPNSPFDIDPTLLQIYRSRLDRDAILNSAKKVELLKDSNLTEARLLSEKLLTHLDQEADHYIPSTLSYYMFDNSEYEKWISILINISFLPVFSFNFQPKIVFDAQQLALLSLLPSKNSIGIGKPNEARTINDLTSISSTCCIIDFNITSYSLSTALKLNRHIDDIELIFQLDQLASKFESLKLENSTNFQEYCSLMPAVTLNIYKNLAKRNISTLKNVLSTKKWIWVGDSFVSSEKVAFKSQIDVKPFLFVLPPEYFYLSSFFASVGVRSSFDSLDFWSIISSLFTVELNKLDIFEVEICLSIISYLFDNNCNREKYLVSENNTILLSRHLLFNDAQWIRKSEVKGLFVHPKISNEVAEALGAKSFRSTIVNDVTDSLKLSIGESFYQSESLTQRLKHILEVYPEGPGVLFELIQNADDANASEISFILNETDYGNKSLLSHKMKDWQGPALYVYNNSIFGEKDYYSLSKIGQGSKLENLSSTGRFGLGFNSVYHFSDVPSFVSGSYLTFLDPHGTYLPDHASNGGGIKIKFDSIDKNRSAIKDQFPDQIQPYCDFFGCDMKNFFNGTLFRFPLRNELTSKRSEIKRKSLNILDLKKIFDEFKFLSSESLLFLKNMYYLDLNYYFYLRNRISVYSCTETDGVKVFKKTYETILSNATQRQNCIWNSMALNDIRNKKDTNFRNLYQNELLPSCCYEFNIKLSVYNEFNDADSTFAEKILVSPEIVPITEYSLIYLISDSIGSNSVKDICLDINNKHLKLIPITSVAALISDSNKLYSSFSGKAFCILPLPINTNLPVHCNAYFELSANRRDLWWGDDMVGDGKIKSDWNKSLLTDGLTKSYSLLLEFYACYCLKRGIENSVELFKFWPISSKLNQFNILINNLFCNLITKQVFYCRDWKSKTLILVEPSKCLLVLKEFDGVFLSIADSELLVNLLVRSGVLIANCPDNIIELFKNSSPNSVSILNSKFIRNWLKSLSSDSFAPDAFFISSDLLFLLNLSLTSVNDSNYLELIGLNLLPLSNNTFGTIYPIDYSIKYYITTREQEKILHDKAAHLLLGNDLCSSALNKKLQSSFFTSHFNLKVLSDNDLSYLLIEIYFKKYMNKSNHILYSDVDMSDEVINSLWSYFLSSNFNCDNIINYVNLHILPVQNSLNSKILAQLNKNSFCFYASTLPEEISYLCVLCGAVSLNSFVNYQHLLHNYVYDGSMHGVLNLLHDLAMKDSLPFINDELKLLYLEKSMKTLFNSISDTLKISLRDFVIKFYKAKVDPTLKMIISCLPIFQVYCNNSIDTTYEYVNLIGFRYLPPIGESNEKLFDTSILKTNSDLESNYLIDIFGISRIPIVRFYKEYFMQKLLSFDLIIRNQILCKIIKNSSLLFCADPTFRDFLNQTPFITIVYNEKHVLRLISEMYDPSLPEFKIILDDSLFLLCHEFSSQELINLLRPLGLNSMLGPDAIVHTFQSLCKLQNTDNRDLERLKYCSKHLLAYIDSNFDLILTKFNSDNKFIYRNFECELTELSKDKFFDLLKSLPWLPVYTDPIDVYLPFGKLFKFDSYSFNIQLIIKQFIAALPDSSSFKKNSFCNANHSRPRNDLYIVSSSLRVVDSFSPIVNEKLLHCMNWKASPPLLVIIFQLIYYIEIWQSNNSATQLIKLLISNIPELYKSLEYHLSNEIISHQLSINLLLVFFHLAQNKNLIIELLREKPWILIDNDSSLSFLSSISISKLIPKSFPNSKHYLRQLSDEFSKYSNLVNLMEISNEVSPEQIVYVIETISKECNGICSDVGLINYIISLLDYFAHTYFNNNCERNILTKFEHRLLGIRDDGKFVLVNSLVYNDAQWVSSNLINREIIQLSHPLLKKELALKLGFQTLREILLVNQALKKEIACSSKDEVIALLTQGVPWYSFIFDLAEVADLLGAHKFEILFDEQSYPTESLLFPGLAEFQGPSISIYMDVDISIETIYNLQSPIIMASQSYLQSINTKELKPLTDSWDSPFINYSIGDSATVSGNGLIQCYRLSDIIFIMSNNSYYILDPSGSNLRGDIEDVARDKNCKGMGRCYPLSVHSKFPDQFKPFTHQGYTPGHNFRGTSIRLPLRLISNEFSLHADAFGGKMSSLLQSFKENFLRFRDLLIFATSIESFSFRHLSISVLKPELLFQTIVTPIRNFRELRNYLFKQDEWKNQTLYSMLVGFKPLHHYYTLILISNNFCSNENSEDVYAISSILGAGSTRDLALNFGKNLYKPIGSTAVHLFHNSQAAEKLAGVIFMGLTPSQYLTSLPVHVSGNFILNFNRALSIFSNTKDIVKTPYLNLIPNNLIPPLQKMILEWNTELFRECVIGSYLDLLVILRDILKDNKVSLYKYWPYRNENTGLLKDIISDFPVKTANLTEPIFLSSNGHFELLSSAYFKPPSMNEFLYSVIEKHVKIFNVPSVIADEMRLCNVQNIKLFTASCFRILTKKNLALELELKNISDPKKFLEIFRFAISDLDENSICEIIGLPLILFENGKFAKWGEEDCIVASEKCQLLFPSSSQNSLHNVLFEDLRPYLANVTICNKLRIREFNNDYFVNNINCVLPNNYKSFNGFVSWPFYNPNLKPFIESTILVPDYSRLRPTAEWIRELWCSGIITLNDISSKKEIENWAFIPTISAELINPRNFKFVIKLSKDEFNSEICRSLMKLGCAVLDWSYFPNILLDELKDDSILTFLYSIPQMKRLNRLNNIDLNKAEACSILDYLAYNFNKGNFGRPFQIDDSIVTLAWQIDALKSLKIYECLYKEHNNIKLKTLTENDDEKSDFSFFMIHPELKFPESFLQLLISSEKMLIYKYPDFFRFIGIEIMDEKKVLMFFITKGWSAMTVSCKRDIITYIKENWQNLNNEEFKTILKSLKFIPNSCNSSFHSADELYDPTNNLFSRLFKKTQLFPNNDFCSYYWLDFLRLIGLKYKLTPDIFIECAQVVENNGVLFFRDNYFDYVNVSVLSNPQYLQNHNESLEFGVELVKLLWSNFNDLISPHFCAKLSKIYFVPLKAPDSFVYPSEFNSDTYILCNYASVALSKDYNLVWTQLPVLDHEPVLMAQQLLLISSPPEFKKVLNHMSRICFPSLDNWKFGDSPANVFNSICKYLTSRLSVITPLELRKISELCLIPISNRLLKPSRLFFRLEHNLSPFMFEIPRQFSSFESLLKKLGAKESASEIDYINFLTDLAKETNGKALNLNEINAVVEVIKLLVDHITSFKSAVDTFVVDIEGFLRPSKSCVFNDLDDLASRCDTSKLYFVSLLLSHDVCNKLGVKMLSSVAIEEISSCSILTLNTYDYLSSKLKDLKVSEIILAILRSKSIKSSANSHSIFLTSAEELQNVLGSFTLKFTSELSTRLIISVNSVKYDVTLPNEHQSDYFVNYSSKEIFLLTNLKYPKTIESSLVYSLLTIMKKQPINFIADNFDITPIAALFCVDVDYNSIKSYFHISMNEDSLCYISRGMPGTLLLKRDLDFLQLTPTREFLVKEIVAYQDKNSKFRYGFIKEDNRKMFDVVGKLVVQITDNEVANLLSSQIWSFKTNVNNLENYLVESSFTLESKNEELFHPSKFIAHSNNTSTTNKFDNIFGDAIKDLYLKAGIPLDLNTEKIVSLNVNLKKSLHSFETENINLKNDNNLMKTRLDEISSAFNCNICQIKEVNLVLSCGHLLCNTCESQLRVKNCPFCRSAITNSVKFFKPFN